MSSLRVTLVLSALAAVGCSAIINPDGERFGPDPDEDAGPQIMLMRDAGEIDAAGFDAGPSVVGDDAGPPVDRDAGGCPGDRCEEGTLFTCDGTVTCPLGCAPGGEARCAEMVPSNVEAGLWRASAPNVDLDERGQVSFDTTRCVASSAESMIVSQAGGGEVCVLMVRSLRVREGVFLRATGSRPLVIMATEEVRVDAGGGIDASTYLSGDGDRALGAGGARGGRPARIAEGASPGQDGAFVAGFDDGGGGGGGYCGSGGDGGEGGSASGGAGGAAMAGGLLMPLQGGSGGGFGSGQPPAAGSFGNVGFGGGGGGALQISTPGTIRVDGFVAAGGGGGVGGRNGAGNWGAGGGGGSGGAVLLEAPEVRFGSDFAITTSGGGGGGSASSSAGGDSGENGVATINRAVGGQRGGFERGADGGDSGGGEDDDGLTGESNSSTNGNGGGGGGAVGCVAIRTLDGSIPDTAPPRISGRSSNALQTAMIMVR